MNITQKVELEIVAKLVNDILGAGYRIAVSSDRGYDTEDMLLGSTDVPKIMEEAFAADECHIFVQPATGPTVTEDGAVVSEGWVYLISGNGDCIISDYTTGIERLLTGALAVAEEYE